MNLGICKTCRRFQKGESDQKWYCARDLYPERSRVLPGYVVYHKSMLHPVGPDWVEPPSWCEYITEQLVALPEDDFKLAPKTAFPATPYRI